MPSFPRLVLAIAMSAASASAQGLTILAPAAPGGGWDQTARAIQQVLRTTGLAPNVQVTNAAGAAGTIGLARFVSADAGNPNTMMVMGLVMVSGIATNKSPVTLNDVTPIARLSGEYEVVVVPKESRFKSLADLVAAFKADPRSISWGGGSAGGTDEILVRLLADAAGVPRSGVNYVAYSGGGQALAAVLGAHVSAGVSGLGEFAAQLETGDLRALAISSPERVTASPIPTLREQSLDVALMNWRGVVAPPGISRAERRTLETLIERMAATREWKETLDRNGWTDLTLIGEPFARFVTEETRRVVPLVVAGSGAPRRDWIEILVLTGLALSCLVVLARRLRYRGPTDAAIALNIRSLLLVAAAIAAQAALLRPAGFIISSALMFALIARAFGSQRLARDLGVGIALAAVVFFAFTRALGVALPAGPFG